MKATKTERCPTCHRRHARSTEANRRYWLLLHTIAEKVEVPEYDDLGLKTGRQTKHSVDVWHIYFKSRFLGRDDVTLPNRKTLTIPRSTAPLDVAEFNTYMELVEHWAGERGVWLDEIACAT